MTDDEIKSIETQWKHGTRIEDDGSLIILDQRAKHLALENFYALLAALKEKDELLKKQSDGYHTMEELYEHRFALYLALCAQNKEICSYTLEREYPGWLCLFMEAQRGKHCLGQISYHLPLKFLPVVEKLFRHHQDNVFDGHTSKDVIARLLALSADSNE